uniref:Ribosome maturation factor RimP n=1 Tax=Magnetococcus massalia (strain MO-1) TaxID=451514 RepID=A0A1S7LM69_MAGMO|nr:Ribosome maturation factor rimP [Candidatus Magnetococcus massalia]
MSDITLKVEELAQQAADTEASEVVDVSYRREGHGWVVRVLVDKLPTEAGEEQHINLDACSRVSRQLASLLEVHDVIPNAYNLEVSSPGIERPLKKEQDFDRFAGRQVEIRTFQPISEGLSTPSKKVEGQLVGMREGMVEVLVENNTVTIPWAQVSKAKLTFDFKSGTNRK